MQTIYKGFKSRRSSRTLALLKYDRNKNASGIHNLTVVVFPGSAVVTVLVMIAEIPVAVVIAILVDVTKEI